MKVHFIGIGGVGISALARLYLHQGEEVSGTNDNPSPETLDQLRSLGVAISLDQNPASLPEADLYIYSDAWLTTNPALIETAQKTKAAVLSYAEALGQAANRYYLIAVAGTHGKTTTAAMLVDILEEAGKDPTAIVGSLRKKTKSNFRAGGSPDIAPRYRGSSIGKANRDEYFIAEADEYRRHFLYLEPKILAITNIDADHLDYYKDLADIQKSFSELVSKIPEDGFLVCDVSNPKIKPILKSAKCRTIDCSKTRKEFRLRFPGRHNIENANIAFATAKILEIPEKEITASLENFQGTWRRFELKGTAQTGALVYDDYAHHPAELKATLKAFREKFPEQRLVAVFQPHLFSRTKILLDEFSESFDDADEIILAPIYPAREQDDGSINSEMLAEGIRQNGKPVLTLENFEKISEYLMAHTGKNDVIVTIGAGDINKVGERLV